MTNTQETDNNNNNNNNTVARPFVLQILYGASMSIITLIGYILYDLYPNFFVKYLVFILFLLSICIFSFFLPSHSGWIFKLNTVEVNKNKKRAQFLGKQIGKRFLGFIPGAEAAIASLVLIFITNPTIIVPIIVPFILFVVYAFNAIIDYFADSFKSFIKK